MKNNTAILLLYCIILLSTIAFAQNNKPVQTRSGMSHQRTMATSSEPVVWNTAMSILQIQFYDSKNVPISSKIQITWGQKVAIPTNAYSLAVFENNTKVASFPSIYPSTSYQIISKNNKYAVVPM